MRALALLLIVLPCVARAGPPFVTDDPEPVDFHHWEVYVASQYAHDMSGVMYTAPHLEVNYGAVPNVQVHIIAPMVYSVPGGGPAEYGYGDTELGVKYRFVQETKRRPQIGTFPLIEAPTGDAGRGLGAGETQVFLPVWAQKSWGRWLAYGGGGLWYNPGPGNRNWAFTGVLIQRQVTDGLAIGMELFRATSSAVGTPGHTGVNIGTIYDFDDGHHLLFSIGRGVDRGPTLTGYLAFQWTFGPRERAK